MQKEVIKNSVSFLTTTTLLNETSCYLVYLFHGGDDLHLNYPVHKDRSAPATAEKYLLSRQVEFSNAHYVFRMSDEKNHHPMITRNCIIKASGGYGGKAVQLFH